MCAGQAAKRGELVPCPCGQEAHQLIYCGALLLAAGRGSWCITISWSMNP